MLEMRQIGPGQVALWEDGVPAGGAEWTLEELRWGRERAKIARLTRLEAAPQDQPGLWAYLEFLWQPLGVAAATGVDGTTRWFSKALEASWQAAHRPS